MKISPSQPPLLPTPPRSPRDLVEGVREPAPARDATDDSARQSDDRAPLVARRDVGERAQAMATPYSAPGQHASRALATYARVAAGPSQHGISDLLGIDEYA